MKKPTPSASIVQLPSDQVRLAATVRDRVRAAIQRVIDEELEDALGVEPYGRSEERCGHRNGSLTPGDERVRPRGAAGSAGAGVSGGRHDR